MRYGAENRRCGLVGAWVSDGSFCQLVKVNVIPVHPLCCTVVTLRLNTNSFVASLKLIEVWAAGSLVVRALGQYPKSRWFEYPSLQGEKSVDAP